MNIKFQSDFHLPPAAAFWLGRCDRQRSSAMRNSTPKELLEDGSATPMQRQVSDLPSATYYCGPDPRFRPSGLMKASSASRRLAAHRRASHSALRSLLWSYFSDLIQTCRASERQSQTVIRRQLADFLRSASLSKFGRPRPRYHPIMRQLPFDHETARAGHRSV